MIDLAQAVIWIALFFLVCGPVHECAHAFTAWRLGDGTAKLFGRVSLDPIVHFDPLGGLLLVASVALSGGTFGFGWAKPTPAGPLSNLALAAVFAVGFRILWSQGIAPAETSAISMLQLVFFTGVSLNLVLMLFNLLPVAPLDGSHVLLDLLDPQTSRQVGQFMDQYGLFILFAVVLLAGRIIDPILTPLISLLIGVPVS
jgi:Zn-dependent protease